MTGLEPFNLNYIYNYITIQTLHSPAPEKLLNTIFCNWNCKGFSAKFEYRRVGLLCSPACTKCEGQSYSNVQLNITKEDSSLFEQFMNIQLKEEEDEEKIDEEIKYK